MNKKRWFPIALAMLTLGACSDDNLSDYENGQPQWNAEGQGYVTLALNLPTTPSVSRANDVFDDGEASEYAVNDATLLIFTGAIFIRCCANLSKEAVYLMPYLFSMSFLSIPPTSSSI